MTQRRSPSGSRGGLTRTVRAWAVEQLRLAARLMEAHDTAAATPRVEPVRTARPPTASGTPQARSFGAELADMRDQMEVAGMELQEVLPMAELGLHSLDHLAAGNLVLLVPKGLTVEQAKRVSVRLLLGLGRDSDPDLYVAVDASTLPASRSSGDA